MLDKLFQMLPELSDSNLTPVSGLYFDVLVKTGQVTQIPDELTESGPVQSFTGPRIETRRPVPFLVESGPPIDRMFQPTPMPMMFSSPGFLAGSMITLPGIAEQAEVKNGEIVLLPFGAVEYSFEFTGANGVEYFCHGQRDISIFHPVTGWSNLAVSVYEKETGAEVYDSISIFGGSELADSVLPFLRTLRAG
jgi:hypothetical protein